MKRALVAAAVLGCALLAWAAPGGLFVPGFRPYGGCYVSASASKDMTAGTFVIGGGTTTIGDNVLSFDMPSNHRLRYTGKPTRKFEVTTCATAGVDANGFDLKMRIAKNGTSIAASEHHRTISTSNDLGWFGSRTIVELATNDYVEMMFDVESGTHGVTVEYGHIHAKTVD